MAFPLRSVPGWRGGHGALTSPLPRMRKSTWPTTLLKAGVPVLSRSITSDGPFRYIKPNFVTRKKHYNEVLIMADRRKLLETAQEVIDARGVRFPGAFWEVFGKRCVGSMHLLEPLEVAIVARAFDAHDVRIDGVDVFAAVAERAFVLHDIPGLAAFVLVDVLSRQLVTAKREVGLLLAFLGRRAADRLYELSAAHALHIVATLLAAGITDSSLCIRVARKVTVHIEALEIGDLAKAADTFAKHDHRDLQLFGGISERLSQLDTGSAADAAAAQAVLDCYTKLEIDNAPEQLRTMASRASAT